MAAENRGLLKALQSVATGSLQVAEFTPLILSKAVDELLFQISKDYDLDYKELKDRYKQPIIDKHASMPGEEPRCKALTKKQKPCSRFAVLNGYCAAHSSEMHKDMEKTTRERELVAYQQQVQKRAATGSESHVWRQAKTDVQAPVHIQKAVDMLTLL
jgi:hypothetical protein